MNISSHIYPAQRSYPLLPTLPTIDDTETPTVLLPNATYSPLISYATINNTTVPTILIPNGTYHPCQPHFSIKKRVPLIYTPSQLYPTVFFFFFFFFFYCIYLLQSGINNQMVLISFPPNSQRTKNEIATHFRYWVVPQCTNEIEKTLGGFPGQERRQSQMCGRKSTPPQNRVSIHSTLSSICESASTAVLSRTQLTLHATRRKPHGASRLVQTNVCLVGENPTCSVPAL